MKIDSNILKKELEDLKEKTREDLGIYDYKQGRIDALDEVIRAIDDITDITSSRINGERSYEDTQ